MYKSITVLGGGFRGLVVSFLLAQKGHKVSLVESQPHCGGILRSFEWDGLYCDVGCHLFDNTDQEQTSLFLELGGGAESFHSISLKYASKSFDVLSQDISIVDLSSGYISHADTWRDELKQAKQNAARVTGPSLKHALTERYGHHIAKQLQPMVRKVYAANWEKIAREAINHGIFSRVKIADDPTSMKLKEDPYLDQVLAVSSAHYPTRFYPKMDPSLGRNFYPTQKGMAGFIENSVEKLKSMGVKIYLGAAVNTVDETKDGVALSFNSGQTIHSDLLISTLPTAINEQLLLKENNAPSEISIPMVLGYLRLPIEAIHDFTYVHNFNPSQFIFRASAPGIYGKQNDQHGMSYVCIECPTPVDGDFYKSDPRENIDTMIAELNDLGLVKKNVPLADFKVIKAPKSYSVPALGFLKGGAKINQKIKTNFSHFHEFNSFSFSKSHILSDAITFIEDFNS